MALLISRAGSKIGRSRSVKGIRTRRRRRGPQAAFPLMFGIGPLLSIRALPATLSPVIFDLLTEKNRTPELVVRILVVTVVHCDRQGNISLRTGG